MLVKALCDYYDILAETGQVLPIGYSNVKVYYLAALTPDGKIDGIIDWQVTENYQAGNKIKERQVPRNVIMPKRTEATKIESNIIEHRPLYLFGLNFVNGALTPYDEKQKAVKSHTDFIEKNKEFLSGIDSPLVNAYRNFIENWNPEDEVNNQFLLNIGKKYNNSYFAFCLSGRPDLLLHEDAAVKQKWESYLEKQGEEEDNKVVSQCAVTGEAETIARIHGKIKGIAGGMSSGGTLIGFNNPSDESYGNEQSYNSNISQKAAVKYVEALNFLLADKNHKTVLDDVTVLFWAASEERKYTDLFSALISGSSETMRAEQTEEMLSELMSAARRGNVSNERIADISGIDPNMDFYIAGLKPNSSRISMKFLYRRKYGEILHNIALHQNDLEIVGQASRVELWQIKRELISPKSSNESIDPALLSKIFEAVLYGTAYPDYLMSQVIRRVKTDTDQKFNYIRAGVIKACINRKQRQLCREEELKVTLDRDNTNPAYLCGRLFAVLEKLQQAASNNSLNRTIKDTYFASAASKPAVIFPKLMKLAQNHLGKVNAPKYYNKQIGEIMDMLDQSFPEVLPLVEQGKFMIGYYQQMQSFFEKKEKTDEEM